MVCNQTKWLVGGGVAVLFVYCFGWMTLFSHGGQPKWLVPLPKSHDHRLAGKWSGTWQPISDVPRQRRTAILKPDGTGEWFDEEEMHHPFEWGTEDGFIFTRQAGVDSWVGERCLFRLSPDEKTIAISKPRKWFGAFTNDMRRE